MIRLVGCGRTGFQQCAILQEEDIINHSIEVDSNQLMRATKMQGWTLRFRDPELELDFGQLAEETFKSNVMCCLVLWLFIVAVQVAIHYK